MILPANVLSLLRTPERALSDLVKRRGDADVGTAYRASLDRMIRDLELEIKTRHQPSDA
jgi:hypothetical protein